ncbi:thioredoxin domain-containing protein [Acidocella sp.]|jgi:hypothetical protein|uniref:thioredoxin domain-containing protein n=1 Tax=Acidocella sp. TaxID=50710 RepID=UPI002F3F196F
MPNMLSEASSPYLLQHRDNPVHWQVWGAAALEEAKARNVPILLSIGYAACHWCHVMAHESFEDPNVAALMNAHYVNIKVDREERPDIDQIYMTALHAMGEQGGWPLTMFLTPDGAPFWGGTYFPPTPRFGRPSFTQVLQALAKAWETDRARIDSTVVSMTRALAANAAARPGDAPGPQVLDEIRARLLHGVDWTRGGLGGAPKFPNAPTFRFLWQESFRTGDTQAADAVDLLLNAMSQGGIYDHVGGGYARYATDENWLIPHFEKMLYDNALILDLLALVYARTGNPLYAARARETVGWLLRDMREEGAFAASEDADSEGVEGKFYVWEAREIAEILGAEGAEEFGRHYDLPEHGNWEERIILERKTPFSDPATEARLEAARRQLLARRSTRIRPGRDDKILADWNALSIAALARAAAVFEEPAWLELANQNFDFLRRVMGQADGRIAHAYRAGKISAAGLLEDQAAMIRAGLALYEHSGDSARLQQALQILIATETYFGDGAGTFFMVADDAVDVPGPKARNVTDGPTPSGIGLMAENYARLFHLTGDASYRARADALLAAFGGRADMLAASPVLLAAADLLENAACVVTGDAALARAALIAPDPAVVVLRASGQALSPGHPAAEKKTEQAAFVCQGGVCALPVTTAEALRALLRPLAKT